MVQTDAIEASPTGCVLQGDAALSGLVVRWVERKAKPPLDLSYRHRRKDARCRRGRSLD